MVNNDEFGERIAADLDGPVDIDHDDAIAAARDMLTSLHGDIEGRFGAAGFYGGDIQIEGYSPPSTPVGAPPPLVRPQVNAIRNLWIGRWNPSDDRFGWSDINDPSQFPWRHPEMAPADGWWVSTDRTNDGRFHASIGDIVVVQRSKPDGGGAGLDGDNWYIGLAAVVAVVGHRGWNAYKAKHRYDVQCCLLPLCRFNAEVPRSVAKRRGRLDHRCFSSPPAAADGSGLNLQFSAVSEPEAAVELLSICGVDPDILAEPDLAVVAARLSASATGNPEYLKLRYDHQIRHAARLVNEHRAEAAAMEWARRNGYLFVCRDALVPLAGYDLLFVDGAGQKLQVEVKGYSAKSLASVHLQPSQVRRATEAAAGVPPDWRLFALLKVETNNPIELVHTASEVLDLIRQKQIGVRI